MNVLGFLSIIYGENISKITGLLYQNRQLKIAGSGSNLKYLIHKLNILTI